MQSIHTKQTTKHTYFNNTKPVEKSIKGATGQVKAMSVVCLEPLKTIILITERFVREKCKRHIMSLYIYKWENIQYAISVIRNFSHFYL